MLAVQHLPRSRLATPSHLAEQRVLHLMLRVEARVLVCRMQRSQELQALPGEEGQQGKLAAA